MTITSRQVYPRQVHPQLPHHDNHTTSTTSQQLHHQQSQHQPTAIMTRNINLPDQSWSFQPSCPLGPSSGNLPSWSNANNGFGNQVLAQQTVYPGNIPVQSAYPSAGLTGTFMNNTLQQGLQQPVHPLPVQIAYPSAGLIGAFTNNTSFQQGFQQAVPVHGPHVVGLAQPQGISMNFSQNFNTQNFDTQNYNVQNFNAQNFNLQNFMNTPLDSNSLPAFNIQQNASGNPGTSAFQNISSDCIPISQDVLQRSNSQDSEDTWHSFSSHSITPPLQSFSSDSISERPRPRRNNQGQVGAPGIRFCVRCRSQLAYCAVWCHSCKQDISNGLPSTRHCKFCRRPASGPTSIVCPGHLRRGIGLPDEEKRVLEGEGICKRCYKADACPGILKCERCRADQKRYGATSRDTRTNRGICLNCKKVVECTTHNTQHKHCAACRKKKAEGSKESRRRKANGGTE